MDSAFTWLSLTHVLIKYICNVMTNLQITNSILLPGSQQPAPLPYP
jgi:hypothetical protein